MSQRPPGTPSDWNPVGPMFVDGMAEELARHMTPARAAAVLLSLIARSERARPKSIYEGTGGIQTDSNGDFCCIMYAVPAGQKAHLTRLVVEAAGYGPATPYTDGAAWVGPMEAPAATGGAVFPILFTDNDSNAWAYRSGMGIYLVGNKGPVSTQLQYSFRVNLEAGE